MKKALLIILAVILLAAGYILANGIAVWTFASKDQTTRADAAIVLGAAAYPHAPSPVYKERLNHAVDLYNDGTVDYILLTGGYGRGNTRSDAAIGAEYVIGKGVPESAILLEEASTVTEENLKNAAEIMEEKELKTALVVSDPPHMKRAMLLAKDAGITAYSSPTHTSLYQGGEETFKFFVRETFYYIGYKWIRIFK